MKKKTSKSKKSKVGSRDSWPGGYCVYTCLEGEWMLTEDQSTEGYYCEDLFGGCDATEEGQTAEVNSFENPSDDGGGTTDDGGATDDGGSNDDGGGTDDGGSNDDGGGTDDGGSNDDGGGDDGGGAFASAARSRSLPKNTALYRFVPSRKVVRRVRGAWAKGMMTPLEMTLKELSKFAPKVYGIVNAMSKNRAVVSFQVLIPAQKIPKKKKGTKTTPVKMPSKKATPKTVAKKKGTGKKKGTAKKKKS